MPCGHCSTAALCGNRMETGMATYKDIQDDICQKHQITIYYLKYFSFDTPYFGEYGIITSMDATRLVSFRTSRFSSGPM